MKTKQKTLNVWGRLRMTQRFFLHDSFVYKHSSASLKYFITRTTNLFITVMSELLTKGCVSFCCSHPSSSPRFIAKILRRRSGLVKALESAESKSVFPFRKKPKYREIKCEGIITKKFKSLEFGIWLWLFVMFSGNTKREGVSMWKGSFAILKKQKQNHTNTQRYFGTIFTSLSAQWRQNNTNLDHSGTMCSYMQLSWNST